MLDDLAFVDAPHLDVIDDHLTASRRDTEQLADVANASSRPMHDQISFCDQIALELFERLESREEPALASSGVSQVALPSMRPVAVVEALFDHVHVPAIWTTSVIEESSDDILGFLRARHVVNLERWRRDIDLGVSLALTGSPGVKTGQAASWKMRPSACRRPDRRMLVPCRIGAADHPRLVRTGRSRVVKTTA